MKITLDVTIFEAIRYLSYLINAIILFIWIKQKALLNYYLVGRWEGSLIDKTDPNIIIKCIIYISCHKNSCKGYLFYETKISDEIIANGVDRIIQYEDSDILPNEWYPIFERVFHKELQSKQIYENAATYQFKCIIKKRWFKDRMATTCSFGSGKEVTGIWEKQ